MGDNGIPAAYNLGIIPAFVEHAHIHPQVIGKVNGPVHGPFIGAYNHQMLFVDTDAGIMLEQGLYKLIGRHEIVKANQRNGILYPGVVGVKGDNVLHSHGSQLLQPHGTVQGFALAALMLTAFI